MNEICNASPTTLPKVISHVEASVSVKKLQERLQKEVDAIGTNLARIKVKSLRK